LKTNGNGNGSFEPLASIVVDTLTTPWDWSSSHEQHFVQFYEQDDFIVDSLCKFVTAGFDAGETAVVAATDAHLTALNERLIEQGFDLAFVTESGNYIPLSAETTLAQLRPDGALSADRFSDTIGVTILKAANRRRIRVFGELVALLLAEGNIDAAIELEGMWNELQLKHPFSLYCAYPMRGFNDRSLDDVCGAHAHVIPAESFTTLPSADTQSRAITLLQQKAQRLESEINERNKVEQDLKQAKRELESQVEALGRLISSEQLARADAETANRMKDEFLATVSHELRTPLNAIIGWTHMLRRAHLDDETRSRAVETIERNAKSQAQLVEDILDVSRMISGKFRLQITSVDVASVINAAIDAVQLAASSKDIKLQVTLDASARHVLGDANRLQQVVWNLLSNAIKFTPPGGRVDIFLKRKNSHAAVTVADTGQGITSEFLPFVFQRFRQADGGSTRRHGGLGLGLALVRHLVELHGGTVKATSEGEGKGATFEVELPLADLDKVQRPSALDPAVDPTAGTQLPHAPTALPVPLLKGRRVLLVDDDRDTLQMLAVMLGDRQAEIQTAGSSEEAMRILEWYKPSVLVLDLAMPVEDGYSLIERIRRDSERANIPAVALTAYVRVEDRARALSAGFNMFVPKPVEGNELIAAISNLTEDAV
jgi:signal transduction histidine kinase